MNTRSLLLGLTLLFAGCGVVPPGGGGTGGGGGGGNKPATAKWGEWTLTRFTGDLNYSDTGCAPKNITYQPSLTSTWNRINVDPQGVLSWYLGFEANSQTYNLAGSAKTESGAVSGGVTDAATGTSSSLSGTYDASSMTVTWTYNQSVSSGNCGTTVSGTGLFAANAP